VITAHKHKHKHKNSASKQHGQKQWNAICNWSAIEKVPG